MRHEALVYDNDHELVEHVTPFLQLGLDEGPTIAVLSRRHWALVREALGPDADRVSFTDCDEFYVRPIDALASYDGTVRRLLAGGATSIRVTGEIPLGPTRDGWGDWISYEAILNRALADRPVDVLCLYGTETAPDAVIDAVWKTHPQVFAADKRDDYHDPRDVVAAFARGPSERPELRALTTTDDSLQFREELSTELALARVPKTKAMDMLVAATEAFENARRHGGGVRALRAGGAEGWFVCEIEDAGPGLDDPLAGYLPPRSEEARGAGLWIARQLVSRLELLPAEPGLTVRLWM
jgi:anti-sigma regulatory factor (Ser/Thr protein kinase)